MNYQGGSGVLIGTPNFNISNLVNAGPLSFPVVQDVSVEFKGKTSPLHGNQIFALDIFDGFVDVTGKGKMIVPPPSTIGPLFFGSDASAGVNRPVQNEPHTVAASVSTTHITASMDLGVFDAATGKPMIPITSGSPTVGEYKFVPYNATGPVDASYTFNAGETVTDVLLNYAWPDASNGETLALVNQPTGSRPFQRLWLFNEYHTKLYALILNKVVLGTFSVPTKQEGHWLSDFDFTACVDAANILGFIEADI